MAATEVVPSEDVVETPVPPETPEQWAARQLEMHAIKEPWFSIVDELEPPEPIRPKVEKIQKVVASHYGVTRDDIISTRRTASVVRPRQVAVYIARHMTILSLPQLGRKFGDRDHTTQIHAIRKIEREMEANPAFAAEVSGLMATIGGANA